VGRFAPFVKNPLRNAGLIVACLTLGSAARVEAQQPRDYMLGFQPAGTFLLVDYFATGAQLSLEHREQIYGSSNDLTLGTVLIPAYPLGEAHARADLRILFLGLGGSVGYRTVWRDLTFEPGDGSYCKACDRPARRNRDEILGDTPGSQSYPLAEARANLFFPFNEHLVMASTAAMRYEGRNDRSFDWFYTSVYDRGVLGRFEVQLFAKHRDLGGIGPYLQWLSLPRDDRHESQWAVGFNAVTRLGLVDRNDLLFLTFLCRPGDGMYGQHNYFAPVRSLVIYRLILWEPATSERPSRRCCPTPPTSSSASPIGTCNRSVPSRAKSAPAWSTCSTRARCAQRWSRPTS
jgi:hypothetical protein